MSENVDLHVAGYHLTELIGSGGMGEVYKAVVDKEGKSLPVGTVVAVKLLHTHLQRIREFQKRFHREANLAAKIDHPNVVRVIEAGIDYRYHYIVMEYVEGLKLTDLMQDKQPLSPQQTIEVMSQICEALHAASHIIDDYSLDVDSDAADLPAVSNIPVRIRSLVHRDVKPDNILIQPRDPKEYEEMSQTGDNNSNGCEGTFLFGRTHFSLVALQIIRGSRFHPSLKPASDAHIMLIVAFMLSTVHDSVDPTAGRSYPFLAGERHRHARERF